MARAALMWSVRELSERSGISTPTIVRFENERTAQPHHASLTILRQVLEAAGIEFLDSDGMRLRRR
jgi:transcriptional regulator with XRE-family HTH domain